MDLFFIQCVQLLGVVAPLHFDLFSANIFISLYVLLPVVIQHVKAVSSLSC